MQVSTTLTHAEGIGQPDLCRFADWMSFLLPIPGIVLLFVSFYMQANDTAETYAYVPFKTIGSSALFFGFWLGLLIRHRIRRLYGMKLPETDGVKVLYEQDNDQPGLIDVAHGRKPFFGKRNWQRIVITEHEIWTQGTGSCFQLFHLDNRIAKFDLTEVRVEHGLFKAEFKLTFHAAQGLRSVVICPENPEAFAAALDDDGCLQREGKWVWDSVTPVPVEK